MEDVPILSRQSSWFCLDIDEDLASDISPTIKIIFWMGLWFTYFIMIIMST